MAALACQLSHDGSLALGEAVDAGFAKFFD
jgi:hypothetical protein